MSGYPNLVAYFCPIYIEFLLLLILPDVNAPDSSHFPLGGIFHAERYFLLFKDHLAESGRQKTKENIVPPGKFFLAENGF